VANDHLNYEKRPDGFLFRLRDNVSCLIRYASPKKVEVEMWRADVLLPPDQGNIYTASFRKRLVESAKLAFNREDGKDVVPYIARDIDNVALALRSQPDDEDSGVKTLMEELALLAGGPDPMEQLIKYAKEAGEYFHTPEPEAYATVQVDDHKETYHLRSRAFKLWLRAECHRRAKERLGGDGNDGDGPSPVLRQQIISDAISQLEATALFEGKEIDVYTRVAAHEGEFYVDLADPLWRAVHIGKGGWEVISDPPVRFVRHKGMTALPVPTSGGDPAKMRELLNLTGEDGDRNWRLILAWLVQAFKPSGPYPVLVLLGPQGSAKSTAQRLLRMLVDPSRVPLRSEPRDEHNLYIDATASWVLAMDNISKITPWLSDALCRLATGGGFSTRQLYENREQELFDAMRPIILNGIGDIVTKPDLLSRAVIINLPTIPREARRLERDIYESFDEAAPGFLGYLFYAISAGLRKPRQTADEVPDGRSRMADFEAWAAATEEALGGAAGSFAEAYLGSMDEATETALETWAPGSAFLAFAKEYTMDVPWIGSATELLKELNDSVNDDVLKRSKEWPKAPNSLTESLNRLAPALQEVGVHIERPTLSKKEGRKLRIYFAERPDKGPSPPPPSSPKGTKAHTYAESVGDDGQDGHRPPTDEYRPPSPEGTLGDDGGDDGHPEDRPPEKPIDMPIPDTGDDGNDGGDGLQEPLEEIKSNGRPRVVSARRHKGKYVAEFEEYVGHRETRGGHDLPESFWANPYMDGPLEERLKKYKVHLQHLLSTEEGRRKLEELRDKVLACFCPDKNGTPDVLTTDDPIVCHAQLILLELEGDAPGACEDAEIIEGEL
jgi:hypothetical protein